MVRREESQGADDDDGPGQVPPRAQRGQDVHQPGAEEIQDRVQREDDRVEDQQGPRGRHVPDLQVRPGGGEGRDAVVLCRDPTEQPQEVEPAGVPAPPLTAELAGHVVQATAGGVAGGDLGQHRGQAQRQRPHGEPPPHHHRGSTAVQAVAEKQQRPGHDGDDREGSGEVTESAHAPAQLLGVAELLEYALVVVQRLGPLPPCMCCCGHRDSPHRKGQSEGENGVRTHAVTWLSPDSRWRRGAP